MSERLTKKTSTLTDQLKDIAERRRQQAEDKFTSGGGPPAHEASDRWLAARERLSCARYPCHDEPPVWP